MDDGKGQKLLTALGRYKFVLLIAALGVLLLALPTGDSGADSAAVSRTEDETAALRQMEEEMEQILSKMSGVGRVDVMLTVQSGRELVLASDTTLRYSGSPQTPDDYDRSSEVVTVSGGSGNDVVVTQERSAQYRGALIVCDGGDSDSVRLRIIEAVAALTGLGSDRIAVVRWGESSTKTDTIIERGEDLT